MEHRDKVLELFEEMSQDVSCSLYRFVRAEDISEMSESRRIAEGLDRLGHKVDQYLNNDAQFPEIREEVISSVGLILSNEIDFSNLLVSLYHHYKETGDNSFWMVVERFDLEGEFVPDAVEDGEYDELFEDMQILKEDDENGIEGFDFDDFPEINEGPSRQDVIDRIREQTSNEYWKIDQDSWREPNPYHHTVPEREFDLGEKSKLVSMGSSPETSDQMDLDLEEDNPKTTTGDSLSW